MADRKVERTDRFIRDLKHLCKKHHDLEDSVDKALQEIAKSEQLPGDRIPGLSGLPVFKIRIKVGNKGKRGGARLIYYCAEALVLALNVFVKNEDEDVPRNELREALRAANLLQEDN